MDVIVFVLSPQTIIHKLFKSNSQIKTNIHDGIKNHPVNQYDKAWYLLNPQEPSLTAMENSSAQWKPLTRENVEPMANNTNLSRCSVRKLAAQADLVTA